MNLCLGCMTKIAEDDIMCPFCGHTVGMTAENALNEGTILENKYVVGKMITNNSLQTTYLGWNAVEEVKVIIKEFFPRSFSTRGISGEIVVSPENSQRYIHALTCFADQYEAQQRFRGMGCLADIDAIIKFNNTIYTVTEFIAGTTLEETFREHTVTFESAVTLITDISKTLTPLHKMGVTHCNISPSNIMVTVDGRVKLMDFGSAKYKLGLTRGELAEVQKSGYAPVELFGALTEDAAKTDVYSLAAVLYKMLTGITPPPAMQRFEQDTLIAPSSVSGVKIERGTENAILNALEVSPDNRTESIDAFLNELYNPATLRVAHVTNNSRSSGKVPLWLKIAAPVLAVALVTTAGVFIAKYGSRMPKENAVVVNDDGTILVPNLVNLTEEEVRKIAGGFLWFTEPLFEIEIKNSEPDEDIEAGKVLKQDPPHLNKDEKTNTIKTNTIKKGSTIIITMSIGNPDATPAPNEEKTMPPVEYMSEAKAREVLEKAGCSVKVEYDYSDTVAEGMVTKQSVKLGEKIKDGQKVTITVSRGAKPEATPKSKNANQSKNTPKPTKAPKPTPTPATPTPATTAPETTESTLPPAQALQQKPVQKPVQAPTHTQPADVPIPTQNVMTESTPKPADNSGGVDSSIFTN